MTDEELAAAWQWTRRYGPANCWTGDTGAAATWIVRLLREVERMRDGQAQIA